jgi:hypothetical protein
VLTTTQDVFKKSLFYSFLNPGHFLKIKKFLSALSSIQLSVIGYLNEQN